MYTMYMHFRILSKFIVTFIYYDGGSLYEIINYKEEGRYLP